ATLAKQINSEHDALMAALLSGAQRAIALGKLLIKAKDLVRFRLGHGHWEEWVATNTKVSDRAEQRCMDLARGEILLMAKGPNLADMTMTEAVKVLGELRAPDELRQRNTRQSQKGRRDPVARAIKEAPLAIVERAWAECSDNEKNMFLRKVST